MKQLIIIYEFKGYQNNKKSFESKLRQFKQFAFLTENACIIWTNNSVVSVRDFLITEISADDKLYVGETAAPAAWTNSIDERVTEYIRNNLK